MTACATFKYIETWLAHIETNCIFEVSGKTEQHCVISRLGQQRVKLGGKLVSKYTTVRIANWPLLTGPATPAAPATRTPHEELSSSKKETDMVTLFFLVVYAYETDCECVCIVLQCLIFLDDARSVADVLLRLLDGNAVSVCAGHTSQTCITALSHRVMRWFIVTGGHGFC